MREGKRRMSRIVAFVLTLVIALGLAEALVPPKDVQAASRFSPPFDTTIQDAGNARVIWADSQRNLATIPYNSETSLCWDPYNQEFVSVSSRREYPSGRNYDNIYIRITSPSRGTIETAALKNYHEDPRYYHCGAGVTSSGEIRVAFRYSDWGYDAESKWREIGYYAVYRINGTVLSHHFTISDQQYGWDGPYFHLNLSGIYPGATNPNQAIMLPDGTWGFNAYRQTYSYGYWFVFLRDPNGTTSHGFTISSADVGGDWNIVRRRYPLVISQGQILPTWAGARFTIDGKAITRSLTSTHVDVYVDGKLLLNGHIPRRSVPAGGSSYYYQLRAELHRVGGPIPLIQVSQIVERWEKDESGQYYLASETWYSSVYPIALANDRTDLQIDESGTTRKIYYTGTLSGTLKVYKWNGSGWTQITYPVSEPAHTEATYAFVVWYTASVPWNCQPISFSSGPSGSWNGNVWVQLQWGTGKTIQMYDGYALRTIATNASTWNSDSSAGKIMPDRAYLASLPDRTATTSLLRTPNTGFSLYDTPNLLYKKMAKPATPAPDGITDYLGRSNYLFNVTGDHNYLISWTPKSNTDTTPPTITNLVVNDGMYSAVSYSVPVVVTATDTQSGCNSVKISTDGTSWTTYVWGTSMSVLLAPGDNNVAVIVVDKSGNQSQPAYQRVYYSVDTSPPELTVAGPTSTSGNSVTLTITARDDKSSAAYIQRRYQYWNGSTWTYSSWGSLDAAINVAIRPTDGVYVIPIQVRDQAGNVSQMLWTVTRSASPTGTASSASGVVVPEDLRSRFGLGATARLLKGNGADVLLTAPTGETTVSYSLDGVTWSPREPVPTTAKQVVLPPGDGVKTLFCRFGERVPAVFQFVVDTTPPELRTWWLGGATVAPGGSATVVIEASDNVTSPAQLQVSYDGGVTWESYKASKAVTVSGSGYRAFVIQVRDQAGNVAQKVLEIMVN
jgi:hypothetical protein